MAARSPRAHLAMDVDDLISDFAERPEQAYELEACCSLTDSLELDRLSYVLFSSGRIARVIELFANSDDARYGVLLSKVFFRYQLTRFPSLAPQAMAQYKNLFQIVIGLSQSGKEAPFLQLIDALFSFLLHNPDGFTIFSSEQKGLKLIQQIFKATAGVRSPISNQDYTQPLVPQATNYPYSPVLYGVFKLFERYQTPELFLSHFSLLLEGGFDPQNITNENCAIIQDETQRNTVFHNIIFTVINQTQAVLTMMQQHNLLDLISKIQHSAHDVILGFIIKLILQETMDDVYSDQVLCQLAQNCQTDTNLLGFLEHQLIDREEISASVITATAQMLTLTLKDESLFDRNKRIVLTILQKNAPSFLGFFRGFLTHMEYSDAVRAFLNEQLSEMFANKELQDKCQEILTSLLYQLADHENVELYLAQFRLAIGNLAKVAVISDDFLRFLYAQFEGVCFQRRRQTPSDVYRFLELAGKAIQLLPVKKVIQYQLPRILLQIASVKPLYSLVCMQILTQKAIYSNKPLQFKRQLYENRYLGAQLIINQELQLVSDEICADLLKYGMQTEAYDLVIFLLWCLSQCYQIERSLENNFEYDIAEELVTQIYLICLWTKRFHRHFDAELFDTGMQSEAAPQSGCSASSQLGPCGKNKHLKNIYLIAERLMLYFSGRASSFAHEASLLDLKRRGPETGIDLEKYFLLMSNFVQRKMFGLPSGSFLSHIPQYVYTYDRDFILPINAMLLRLDTRFTSEQKLALQFSDFQLKINAMLRENGPILEVYEQIKGQSIIQVLMKQQDVEVFCQISLFGIPFKFLLPRQPGDIYKLTFKVTESPENFEVPGAPFHTDLYYDNATRKYKGCGVSDCVYSLQLYSNEKYLGSHPLMLPPAVFVLEKTVVQMFSYCLYEQISFTQNQIPILDFQHGNFYIYRMLMLRQRQERIPCIHLGSQKSATLSEQELINVLADVYFAERPTFIRSEMGVIESTFQCITITDEPKSVGKQQNTSHLVVQYRDEVSKPPNMVDYQVQLYPFETEMKTQTKAPPIHLRCIKLRPIYGSLNQPSTLNILIYKLGEAANIEFELMFLNSVIWSSKKSFAHFIEHACFEHLLQLLEKRLESFDETRISRLVLSLLSIIGMHLGVSSDGQLMQLIINDNVVVDGLLSLMNSNLWNKQVARFPAFYEQFGLLLVKNWSVFEYQDRIKLFQYLAKSIISGLAQNETKMLDYYHVIARLFYKFYYSIEGNCAFVGVSNDEMYMLANTATRMLLDLLRSATLQEEARVRLFRATVGDFIFELDNILTQKMRAGVELDKMTRICWFLSLMPVDVFVLLLEQVKQEQSIELVLQVVNVIQSAQQLLPSLNEEKMLSKENHQNHLFVQNTMHPMNLSRDIHRIICGSPEQLQAAIFSRLQQCLVNRYIATISSDYSIQIQPGPNNFMDRALIRNANVLFTLFSISRRQSDYLSLVPNILQLVFENDSMSCLELHICLTVIEDMLKRLDFQREETVIAVEALRQKGSSISYVTKFIMNELLKYEAQQNRFTADGNALLLNITKVLTLIFEKANLEDAVTINTVRQELFSSPQFTFRPQVKSYTNMDVLGSFLLSMELDAPRHIFMILLVLIYACNRYEAYQKGFGVYSKLVTDLVNYMPVRFTAIGIDNDFAQYLGVVVRNVGFSFAGALLLQADKFNPAVVPNYEGLQDTLASDRGEFLFTDSLRDAILQLTPQSISDKDAQAQNAVASFFLDVAKGAMDLCIYEQFPISDLWHANKQSFSTLTQMRIEDPAVASPQRLQFFYAAKEFIGLLRFQSQGQSLFSSPVALFRFVQAMRSCFLIPAGPEPPLAKVIWPILHAQHKALPDSSDVYSDALRANIAAMHGRESRRSIDLQELQNGPLPSDQLMVILQQTHCFSDETKAYEQRFLQEMYELAAFWPEIIGLEYPVANDSKFDSIVQTLQQAMTRHLVQQVTNWSAKEFVQGQMILLLDQNLAESYDQDILSFGTSDIGCRLAGAKSKSDVFFVSESPLLNGECYQRLPLVVRTMRSAYFQTQKVLQVFRQFKLQGVELNYCMHLNPQCSRVGFAAFHQGFLYLFADSPTGQYFLMEKQTDTYQDFDYLVKAHVEETVKALRHVQNRNPDTKAEIFTDAFWAVQLRRIAVNQIISVVERNYAGIHAAVDIYTADGGLVSLVLAGFHELQKFTLELHYQKPLLLRFHAGAVTDEDATVSLASYADLRHITQDQIVPGDNVSKELKTRIGRYLYGLLCSWKSGRINTFKTIYELNILGKRSVNDLSQYPVFPQLCGADVAGADGELRARVLKSPVLFQSPARLNQMLEKYEAAKAFGDAGLSAIHFMHCAVPCWMQLRIEPFTSAHLLLQSCKFDAPDRLFTSFVTEYQNATALSQQNCEELLPETFYETVYLYNVNHQPLGELQDGTAVQNVETPPIGAPGEFTDLLQQYLEFKELQPSMFSWMATVFSRRGWVADGAAIFPKITNWSECTSANADTSLHKLMEEASESSPRSAIMKLMYFGRQPQPLFSGGSGLGSLIPSQDDFKQQQQIMDRFLQGFRVKSIVPEDDQIRSIPLQKTKLSHKPGQIVPAIDLQGHSLVYSKGSFEQKHERLVLKPGRLAGRSQFFNAALTEQPLKTDCVSPDYRQFAVHQRALHQVQTTRYQQLTSRNSLLFNKKYILLPAGFWHFQSPGQHPDHAAVSTTQGFLEIYKLPQAALEDRHWIGHSSCFAASTGSNFSQLQETSSFFIGRAYGVVDLYSYDLLSRQLWNVAYFPISDRAVQQLFYSQPWGILAAVVDGEVCFISVPHTQKLASLQTDKEVFQVQFSVTLPLAVVLERGRIRVLDLRTLQITLDLSEGFRCCAFCDQRDELLLAKNSLILRIANIGRLRRATNKWPIELVGQFEGSDLTGYQIENLTVFGDEVWASVQGLQGDWQLAGFCLDRL